MITFTAATDNANGSGIARYNVYRSGALVGNTATTTFTDSTLTTSGTYVYTVKAVDGAGNESGATGSVDGGLRQRRPDRADEPERRRRRRTRSPS